MWPYTFLVPVSRVQARSIITGNSASTVDVKQVFKSMLNALVNKDYYVSVDIHKNQSILDHSLSKVDFSVDTYIYMLPRDLELNIAKTAGYNNKTLISNRDIKRDSNRNIKKAEVSYQKSTQSQSPASLPEKSTRYT